MNKKSVKTRSVSLTEITIDKDDLIIIGEIIYGLLKKSKSCQIFLAEEIYEALQKNDIIVQHNYFKDCHYEGSDDMFGVERTYAIYDSKEKKFADIFFASNTDNFEQVTYFEKGKLEYTHYLEKMKKIYIITFT